MTTTLFAPRGGAMARRIVVPLTRAVYDINNKGSVLVDDADVAWFQTQGFTQTPPAVGRQVVLYAPRRFGQEIARQVTNPNTGNTYNFNGAGAATIAQIDIAWFQMQGYTST